MGHVALCVSSLDNQVEFYTGALGIRLNWRSEKEAGLGTERADLIRLVEEPAFRRYRGTSGLYHFAILLPDRPELARALARLLNLGYPNYPTDHVMTKTTYLDDPEGNGIELYTESPEDGSFSISGDTFVTLRADGTASSGREPLDVEALLQHLRPDDRLDRPVPDSTRIGHVHLHVSDLDAAIQFYHGVMGFDLMGVSRSFRAAFVSAGGYHHHLGLNTWQGEGAVPQPADALGLSYFTILLPDAAELDGVVERVQSSGHPIRQVENGYLTEDPSRNRVRLASQQ